ncbi:MAG TPA: T9SS type A sorting domain-containing protein [Flavobacteriales bacterium]|nr:T9SS type A sorting domain-containing protein [Flavobacteriales bacterium]HMR27809.1 T9SS type A sorting domain-containing protein [Flavobacteriales bacterium]
MRAAVLPLALLPLLASAQAWCPPGATWTFEYTNILGGYSGVQRVEYTADTLLSGFTAQRLDQTNVVAPWGTTNYTVYPSFPLFTRYANEVVFIWDNNSSYDTLFWFGAAPGDHWNAAGWPDGSTIMITVMDTATEVIDGVPLRRLVVEPIPGSPVDTVYERIGGLHLHINAFNWYVTDVPYDGLWCYSDQDIDFAMPGVSDCGYTLSVPDRPVAHGAVPFPNPGTTHFTLDLPHGPHTITLFDATGRMVLQQRTTDARPVIGTEGLPAGLYRITVWDERGAVMGATWVKAQ